MIPAEFDYLRASSLDEAVQLLVEHGDEAKLLAGGHSLVPLMKLRLARPGILVDIRGLPELQGVQVEGDVLSLAAGTTHRVLERDPLVAEHAPLIAQAAATIGDPQVRTRGTLGGSICHADPAADLPVAILALGGEIRVRGPQGQRDIPVADFFVDFWQTAITEDEVVVAVRLPLGQGRPTSFQKFRQRSQDWGVVTVAAVGGDRPAVALGNMGMIPIRAHAVEAALSGGATAAEAARFADVDTKPSSDLRATAAYRRHLATVLTRRALAEAGVG